MIKGSCFTNLDGGKRDQWPKEFVALPRVGDSVEAKSGRTLKIVEITHITATIRVDGEDRMFSDAYVGGCYVRYEPQIKVELYK